ncbi:bacillithiol system redox-active protein YtxJ [Paenibacillus koleovorans]|uniref:bacillithiol system redox-active protein YtxJ n=1 Tax=Paenibacillus koleovorans TaxID=121608 RepID=UPI000FDB239B|nr:bacillithiol system redox-active protein YtxJ [Paenibacillus koleovorans]
MVEVTALESEKMWLQLLQTSKEQMVCVLKHSTRCPISSAALEQWDTYLSKTPNEDVEYALVLVVEDRPVSNLIAETLDVKHESPQLIVVKNGKAVSHTSHWKITESSLGEMLHQ